MCNVAYAQMAQVAAQTYGQAQTYRANVAAANTGYVDAVTGIQQRAFQQDQALADQMQARSRDAMREVGSVQAIFADSGMSGNSQDRVVADAQRAAGADLTTMERNREIQRQQSYNDMATARAQRTARVNGVASPNYLGAGLQIAGIEMDRRNRSSSSSTPNSGK